MPKTDEPVSEEKMDAAVFLSEDQIQPVILDVPMYTPPPIEDRELYWCGATKDCPMDVTAGGFEFPKTVGRLVEQETGKFQVQAGWKPGIIHSMTKKQLEVVKEHLANRVVRNFRPVQDGEDGKGPVRYLGELKGISGSTRRVFTPHPTDKPLGQFVYMIRVRHKEDRPLENPPTTVPRNW